MRQYGVLSRAMTREAPGDIFAQPLPSPRWSNVRLTALFLACLVSIRSRRGADAAHRQRDRRRRLDRRAASRHDDRDSAETES